MSIVIVYSASTRMEELNNKCSLVFSSEVGSSAHHFLDIIKGSRMSLISLGDDDDDDDDDDVSLITNNPKSWVI